jgi:hypothetical protein
MALSAFTVLARNLATAAFSWTADVIHLILLTNTYTFSAAHDFRDDLSNEVTGTNYTAGGLLLDNRTASAANPSVLTADDEVVAQSGAGFANARKYVLAKITGGSVATPADDPLIYYGTAGADFGNVAGQLTLDVPASFITITA